MAIRPLRASDTDEDLRDLAREYERLLRNSNVKPTYKSILKDLKIRRDDLKRRET